MSEKILKYSDIPKEIQCDTCGIVKNTRNDFWLFYHAIPTTCKVCAHARMMAKQEEEMRERRLLRLKKKVRPGIKREAKVNREHVKKRNEYSAEQAKKTREETKAAKQEAIEKLLEDL